MTENLLLATDSYKLSHYVQYPEDTEKVYSYFEPRVGAEFKETVFFGLQYLMQKHLEGQVVTQEKIDEAEAFAEQHIASGVFNKAGWQHILDKHQGRLPIKIKAVPEGTPVPESNVLMTIENTDPACYWLTNYLETLLVQVWYPCTVATVSREVKRVISQWLESTGTPDLVGFKLHDFGFRGVSSFESAMIGGMAHLVNFMGTDTIAGIVGAQRHYDASMCGFSIPASEHSTMTAWGREGEADAMRNMLRQYPTGLVACVSDSYDMMNAVDNIWGDELRDEVLARDGCLVVRPDSGDPVDMVIRVLDGLGKKFGYEVNDRGSKVLNEKVRVIQGDGCSFETIGHMLAMMGLRGWSADNVAFGMGGGLLQKVNRDTQRFAFKCSHIEVNGEARDVRKSPADDMTKASKGGRLKLVKGAHGYATVAESDAREDLMKTVFLDGVILHRQQFDDIRKRAEV